MKVFRTFIKEYFNFSKRERNGIVVLFIIISLIFLTRFVLNSIEKRQRVDFSEFEQEIDSFIAYQTPDFSKQLFQFDPNTASSEELLSLGLSPLSVNGIIQYQNKGWKFYKTEDILKVKGITEQEYEHIKDYIKIHKKEYYSKYEKKYTPKNKNSSPNTEMFVFDPNTATKQELLKLGFIGWQCDNIIKYREKGGVFKQVDDIKKIYGLDEEFVNNITPWIKIEEANSTNNNEAELLKIDLNSCNAEDLQKIKGIGKLYSKRIIEYRTKLGGYIKPEQILEVYGIDQELYSSVKQQITLQSTHIEKININKADYKKLISHPYIDKETTIGILNYRKFKGKILEINELKEQKVISEAIFDKIYPYISVE